MSLMVGMMMTQFAVSLEERVPSKSREEVLEERKERIASFAAELEFMESEWSELSKRDTSYGRDLQARMEAYKQKLRRLEEKLDDRRVDRLMAHEAMLDESHRRLDRS